MRSSLNRLFQSLHFLLTDPVPFLPLLAGLEYVFGDSGIRTLSTIEASYDRTLREDLVCFQRFVGLVVGFFDRFRTDSVESE